MSSRVMSRYSDSSLMSGLGRRRRRGRGIGSILGSIADHFLGGRRRRRVHRRRVHRRRRHGVGRRRVYRRRVHRRRVGRRRVMHRRGRGFLDVLKKAGSFALPVIASAVLGKAGSAIGSKLFGGKRRHHRMHRKRGGGHRPGSLFN